MSITHLLKKRFSECLSETVGQISSAYFCALYLFCERNILQIIYKLQKEEDASAYIKDTYVCICIFFKKIENRPEILYVIRERVKGIRMNVRLEYTF